MCGIAGLLAPKLGADALQRRIEAMTRSLLHRGPDDGDIWIDPASPLALGHRRLSIIDLSPLGRQPMHSVSGRYSITYNGEIYNFPALRAELETSGIGFRGHSDTEVMLAAIESWGLAATLTRLEGMFALALWDHAERRLTLVRDRLGIKPLYWRALPGGGLAFASQPRALLGLGGQDAIAPGAVAAYLRFNYVPTPLCIWQGMHKLPPGHMLEATLTSISDPQPYWSLVGAVRAEPPVADEAEAKARLQDLLQASIAGHMLSDVPIGAFLSGGVDSSLVAALMQRHSSRPIRSFTIGYRESDYDESEPAAAVARHLGTHHTHLQLSDAEAMQVVPSLAEIYDEPFADASQVATLLVSRMTRQHVTVALTGDGGDEGFAGYNRHLMAPAWDRMRHWPGWLRRGLGTVCTTLTPRQWDALGQMLPRAVRPPQLGEKINKLANVLQTNTVAGYYQNLIQQWPDPAALMRISDSPQPVPARFDGEDLVAFLQRLDATTYLHDDVLTKVDRASMAVGLEARVPLLDHRIVSFGLALPRDMKVQGRTGKWLLRQILDEHVPRALTDRPKTGFAVPIASWLRGPMREWAEDLLSERALEETGLLHPEPIRRAWAEHVSGRSNRQYGLWGVLMLQTWQRHWLKV